jgi:hypothetical protein
VDSRGEPNGTSGAIKPASLGPWFLPALNTLSLLVLLSHRSASPAILSRYTYPYFIVLLAMGAFTVASWWLLPLRHSRLSRTLRALKASEIVLIAMGVIGSLAVLLFVVGFSPAGKGIYLLGIAPPVLTLLALVASWGNPVRHVQVLAVNVALTAVLLEGSLVLLRRVPALSRAGPGREVGRQLYLFDRNIIQFMPEFARYDGELSYLLKPGVSSFSNTEFTVRVHANSVGLRDDEAALRTPRVVVTGDSHAMGWGVEEEETFAHIIGERTSLPTLNAAMASYGTAREMLLLERIELDSLRCLIIQYSENDYEENKSFHEAGGTLETMGEDAYRRVVDDHARSKVYYPGKYIRQSRPLNHAMDFFGEKIGALFGRAPRVGSGAAKPAGPEDEARMFLEVLGRAGAALDGAQLLVLEINGYSRNNDGEFISALRAEIARGDYPGYIEAMKTLDVSRDLTDDAFWVLDDHMNARGHAVVAERVIELLGMAGGS